MVNESDAHGDRGSQILCFALSALPSPCFVRLDDVLEVTAPSDVDANTIRLEELGLQGIGTLGARLLRFRQAPDGPGLLFRAELTSQALSAENLLPLPRSLFPKAPYSNLVVVADQVPGLLLSVPHCLALGSTVQSLFPGPTSAE